VEENAGLKAKLSDEVRVDYLEQEK